MKTFLMIFALGLLLPSCCLAADAETEADALRPVQNPQPVLQDLQRKMSSLRSVYLEFTQERHLQLFADPLLSKGVMLIDRPDLIRWETTEPYESILLGGGKSVAQFEMEDGTWKKLKLGFPQMMRQVMDQMASMHQGKLDALASDFTIGIATNLTQAVLTLVPKDENVRSLMSSLEVHMQPDLSATRHVVMNEPGGDFTKIIFEREHRNVPFPDRTFDQSKPLDLAVIRAAEQNAP